MPPARTATRNRADRGPRRLSPEARLEQLVEVAMPIVAEQGPGGFTLDEVAARAGVTRNLLYHYFPRGRMDLVLAVGERAGRELTDGWITDESIPLQERMAANFRRFVEHATTPTDAWLIHRRGRAANDPEINRIIERFEEIIIESVSLNQYGTPNPPAIARVAIKGFVAFAETVLDEARATGAPRDQVTRLVAQTFFESLRSLDSASE